MGMQNMQVQQPMQQSSGKGASSFQSPNQGSVQSSTPSYFDMNPDVAQSYQQNSYGMTPDQFAQTHYQKYGQAEGRSSPVVTNSATSGQPRFGQPSQYSNTLRPWDNATIAPQYSAGGKGGKNGGMQSNYPTARTNWSYSTPTSTSGKSGNSGMATVGRIVSPTFGQSTSNASNVDYGGY